MFSPSRRCQPRHALRESSVRPPARPRRAPPVSCRSLQATVSTLPLPLPLLLPVARCLPHKARQGKEEVIAFVFASPFLCRVCVSPMNGCGRIRVMIKPAVSRVCLDECAACWRRRVVRSVRPKNNRPGRGGDAGPSGVHVPDEGVAELPLRCGSRRPGGVQLLRARGVSCVCLVRVEPSAPPSFRLPCLASRCRWDLFFSLCCRGEDCEGCV